jgi:rhamnogalacturonan endolyase
MTILNAHHPGPVQRFALRMALIGLAGAMMAVQRAEAAFGLTTTPEFYTVDTGAGLTFSVRRWKKGRYSAGDISSLWFNGVEFQSQIKGSHVNSGLGAATVSATPHGADCIKIEVGDGYGLTHYYLARSGYPHIYMGTYFTEEPEIGFVRYIVRIPAAKLPNGPSVSDIRNNAGAIEAKDIFAMSDGTTRSKHYSNRRLIDWKHIGATGEKVGVWIARDNHEGGSGGPFYRCLTNQCGDDQELTYVMNYGEAQTEAFRTEILNTYVLVFTTGAAPGPIDTSWLGELELKGYVAPIQRGRVIGPSINGLIAGHAYTVGFSNLTAQSWASVQPVSGAFDSADLIPGTYAVTVYKNELGVWSGSATVTAGGTHKLDPINITGDPESQSALWRIGTWDGTPDEFLNGSKVTMMHPSDKRMTPWRPADYVVGASSPAAGFPCYQWKAVNSPQTIKFDLTVDQLRDRTVRVGITTAHGGGRPRIAVNQWKSPLPAPSDQPHSRTMTVGTYRGKNTTFEFSVPSSAFVVGTNTMWIEVASGSGGIGFLSAGFSYDCIDLY